MKKFLAVYTGSEAGFERKQWHQLSEEKQKEVQKAGMQAWLRWAEANAGAIVDQGSPLGKTKRASTDGITDSKNHLAGYVIVQAESQEAAAKLFLDHPHFSIFPGDGVEIMECLPIPKR
jgi:hypothetical protein